MMIVFLLFFVTFKIFGFWTVIGPNKQIENVKWGCNVWWTFFPPMDLTKMVKSGSTSLNILHLTYLILWSSPFFYTYLQVRISGKWDTMCTPSSYKMGRTINYISTIYNTSSGIQSVYLYFIPQRQASSGVELVAELWGQREALFWFPPSPEGNMWPVIIPVSDWLFLSLGWVSFCRKEPL